VTIDHGLAATPVTVVLGIRLTSERWHGGIVSARALIGIIEMPEARFEQQQGGWAAPTMRRITITEPGGSAAGPHCRSADCGWPRGDGADR